MLWSPVARNQRGALTQAGAGIAASRRKSDRFRAAIRVSGPQATRSGCPTLANAGRLLTPRGRVIMTRLMSRFVIVALLAGSLSACSLALHNPSVAELKYNPGRYQNHDVAID